MQLTGKGSCVPICSVEAGPGVLRQLHERCAIALYSSYVVFNVIDGCNRKVLAIVIDIFLHVLRFPRFLDSIRSRRRQLTCCSCKMARIL